MNRTILFLSLFATALISSVAYAADNPVTKKIRTDECYTVWTMTGNDDFSEATWWIPNRLGKFDASPETPAQVIAHYRVQDSKWAKNGIILFSNSHSIPDTKNETETMSPHLAKLYRLKVWRDAENQLVEALVAEANKEGVPVWINATRFVGGRPAIHLLLTDPKLTLKK